VLRIFEVGNQKNNMMTISIQYLKMPSSPTMTDYTIAKLQKLA